MSNVCNHYTQGGIGSIAEVLAMTIFVYLILPEVSSDAGILLLSGVFIAQIAMDIYYTQIPYYFGSHNQNAAACRGSKRDTIERIMICRQVHWHQSHFNTYILCAQKLELL